MNDDLLNSDQLTVWTYAGWTVSSDDTMTPTHGKGTRANANEGLTCIFFAPFKLPFFSLFSSSPWPLPLLELAVLIDRNYPWDHS